MAQSHDPTCSVQDYEHICEYCQKNIDCAEWHLLGKHKSCNVGDPTTGLDLSVFVMKAPDNGPTDSTIRDTTN